VTQQAAAMRDGDDFLRLDRQVCFPLYAASNLFGRLYRPVLAKLGLTYPQYLVMLVLWEQPLAERRRARRAAASR
jgi:MarR family transcriptional regulator, organic hydroperoxide resistance regulator